MGVSGQRIRGQDMGRLAFELFLVRVKGKWGVILERFGDFRSEE